MFPEEERGPQTRQQAPGSTSQHGQGQRPPQQRPTQQGPPPAARPEVLSGPPALLTHLPQVQGLHGSVDTLQDAIRGAVDKVHLLSPTVNPEYIPPFHEIAIRLVVIDPRDEGAEVYSQFGFKDGEVALTKVALNRIARAAGISWDPVRSGRLDDGSDPHYVHFRSVGYIRDLDGSRRTLVGEKEIDLRDGNPTIFTDDPQRMNTKARGFTKAWSGARLEGAREHILAMAESKAMNRVVRSLGVKQKYLRAEIAAKPFAVLALVLTGRHENGALQEHAQIKMLDAALESSRELYPDEAGPRALRVPGEPMPPPVQVERHAPPAIEDAAARAARDPEEWCQCPQGVEGIHLEGCTFEGVSDAR